MKPAAPRRPALYLLLAAGLLSLLGCGNAQAQSIAPGVTAETVLRYLQKDYFLSPGIGFQKVQIGNSFNQVAQAWGQPNKKLESTEAGTRVVWIYDVGQDGQIAVAGGASVRTIRVLGSFNSPFSSTEGARFGMTPHQVITIYGQPLDPDDLTRLSYPGKGIAFAFENGGLKAMQVTAAAP